MKEYNVKMEQNSLCTEAKKGTAIPAQDWRGSADSRRVRLPDLKRICTKNR